VCDCLRNFGGENETRGRLALPAVHCGDGRRAIERGVNFHGAKFRRVVGQVIGGFHARRIERALPAGRGESAKSDVDESAGVKLLADLRDIFANTRKLGFPTEQLIFELRALPESRWEELTPIKLARLLRPYGISPGQLWTGETSVRGYDVKDFETVFDRYVPASEPLEELDGE
jgi:hypothetical protein